MIEPVLPVRLCHALAAYQEGSKQFLSSEQAASIVTTPLYHYTSAAGLSGIIDSRSIWMSDSLHLNDPKEVEYGLQIASNAFAAHSSRRDPRCTAFCQAIDDKWREAFRRKVFRFYFACFSRTRDDLGQWRAYGDDGRGVAIGFSPSVFSIRPHVEGHIKDFLTKVYYGVSDAQRRHKAVIDRGLLEFTSVMGTFSDQEDDVITAFCNDLGTMIVADLIFVALSTKHEQYQHENEVRLFTLGEPKELDRFTATRVRGSSIVPYIPLPLPDIKSQVHEIVVGPSAPPFARDGVERLLALKGVPASTLVNSSTIPYRSM